VVEDAIAGIDAAKAGGMLAAGVGEAKTYEKTDYPMDKVKYSRSDFRLQIVRSHCH